MVTSVLTSHSVKKKLLFCLFQTILNNQWPNVYKYENIKLLFSFFNQVPVVFAHTMTASFINRLCPVRCQTSGARRSWGQASVLSFSKFIVIFMPIVVYVYTSHIFILLVVSWFWSKQSVPNFHGPYGESGVWKHVQNRVFFSLLLNY